MIPEIALTCPSRFFLFALLLLASSSSYQARAGVADELAIAPENRCSKYNSKEYSYPQSVEPEIIRRMGGRIYGPYTGLHFSSREQTDIEHIVARSEAHDSGLCAASSATRKQFARDLDNLTLASPAVNRHQKKDKDAAQWLPGLNQCWYVAQVVAVKRKYSLTVDQREAEAIDKVLGSCTDATMLFTDPANATVAEQQPQQKESDDPVQRRYDDNGNGRITCAEARAHGIAPVPRSHPAYKFMRDGDGDGVVCE